MDRKSVWYEGEAIVEQYYQDLGFELIQRNFTIRGGELDLIMANQTHCVFVEVKVVNTRDDLHDYITPKKLTALHRTIQTYLWQYPTDKSIQFDVVFVKDNMIIDRIEDIVLS